MLVQSLLCLSLFDARHYFSHIFDMVDWILVRFVSPFSLLIPFAWSIHEIIINILRTKEKNLKYILLVNSLNFHYHRDPLLLTASFEKVVMGFRHHSSKFSNQYSNCVDPDLLHTWKIKGFHSSKWVNKQLCKGR